MAGKSYVSVSLSATTDGGASVNVNASFSETISGNVIIHSVQTIGSVSSEQVNFPSDLGTPSIVLLRNIGTTYDILISGEDEAKVVSYLIRLKPGEAAVFRLNGNDLYAKGDGGSSDLEYVVVED